MTDEKAPHQPFPQDDESGAPQPASFGQVGDGVQVNELDSWHVDAHLARKCHHREFVLGHAVVLA